MRVLVQCGCLRHVVQHSGRHQTELPPTRRGGEDASFGEGMRRHAWESSLPASRRCNLDAGSRLHGSAGAGPAISLRFLSRAQQPAVAAAIGGCNGCSSLHGGHLSLC